MKRKLLVAIPILAIIAIIVVILILTRDKGAEEIQLLSDSGYPVTLSEDGAELKVTLDGSRTQDFSWSFQVEDENLITVTQKGEEKKGKVTYVITPKVAGLSEVLFVRTGTVAGTETTAVSIVLPVLVYKEEAKESTKDSTKENTEDGKLIARLADEAYLLSLNEIGGTALEYPYLLENREDGTAVITFPNGESDWTFIDPDGVAGTSFMVGSDGKMIRNVYRIATGEESSESADSGEVQEGYHWGAEQDADGVFHLTLIKDEETSTEVSYYDEQLAKYKGHSSVDSDGSATTMLLAMSKSQNVTEFIKVNINTDGSIRISKGEEPKQEK